MPPWCRVKPSVPYCGVGCRLRVEGSAAAGLQMRRVSDAPANLGRLCAKGLLVGATIDSDGLDSPGPTLRSVVTLPPRQPTGPPPSTTSPGFSPPSSTATVPKPSPFTAAANSIPKRSYLVSKLFKGHLGMQQHRFQQPPVHGGGGGRLPHQPRQRRPTHAVTMTSTRADVIFIIGSNTAERIPSCSIASAPARRPTQTRQVVVVDPRRTATAAAADLHLPVAPGGDIALLNALGACCSIACVPIIRSSTDHTSGFEDYRLLAAQAVDLDDLCRVRPRPELLQGSPGTFAVPRGFLSFYCMGLNQSTVGMWKNNSLINLHLLTGQIGKPGAGPFSLTGQPNAMGGREAGLLSPIARLSHRRRRRRTVASRRLLGTAAWHHRPESRV